MKTCTRCGIEKPFSEFVKRRASRDGLNIYCKECHNKLNKKWATDNPEKNKESKKKWQKNNPERFKESIEKWRKNNPKKYSNSVEYRREYHKNRYKNDPEYYKKRYKEWVKNNPEKIKNYKSRRRARKKSNGVFVILEKELKKIYSSPCFACGATENLTQEHLIPVSRGGRHSIGNLTTLCHSCNSSKGSKTLMEWRLAQTRNALVE